MVLVAGLAVQGYVDVPFLPGESDEAAETSGTSVERDEPDSPETAGATIDTTVDQRRAHDAVWLETRTFEIGDCVTWSATAGADGRHDTDVVPCEEPHRVQISGKLELDDLGDDYPSDDAWDVVLVDRCRHHNEAMLGGALDPHGRVWPYGIVPRPEGWAEGDRTAWCGVRLAGDDDAAGARPFRGSLIGVPQEWHHPAGTCIGSGSSRPAPCDEPHLFEITGSTLLADGLSLPDEDDHTGWGALVGDTCDALAEAHLGGALPAGVSAGWLPMAQESYDAGSRRVHCMVGRYQGEEFIGKTGSLAPPALEPTDSPGQRRGDVLDAVEADPCALLSAEEVASALGTGPVECELSARDPSAELVYGPEATWSTADEEVLLLQLATNASIALNDGVALTVGDLYAMLDDNLNATVDLDVGWRAVLGVIDAPPFPPVMQVQVDSERVLLLIWHSGGDMFELEPLGEAVAERWQVGRT